MNRVSPIVIMRLARAREQAPRRVYVLPAHLVDAGHELQLAIAGAKRFARDHLLLDELAPWTTRLGIDVPIEQRLPVAAAHLTAVEQDLGPRIERRGRSLTSAASHCAASPSGPGSTADRTGRGFCFALSLQATSSAAMRAMRRTSRQPRSTSRPYFLTRRWM